MTAETMWLVMSIGGGLWAGVVAFFRYVVRPCRRAIGKGRTLVAQVEQMHTSLGTNGGSTLADVIRQTHGLAQVSDARLDLYLDLVDRPLFECSADGANVRINDAFTKAFGYSPAEMLGQRWIRILHPDDRDDYIDEWREAIRDMRAFQTTARYISRAGVVLEVHVVIEPRISTTPPLNVIRWLGRVEVLRLLPAPGVTA